jgi:uncharacterized protein
MIYLLNGEEFEWDEEKYAVNLRKHKVTFEEAAEVFFDPEQQFGDASVKEEIRDYIIGYSWSNRMLLVVYVERGWRTRIISARPATSREREDYE